MNVSGSFRMAIVMSQVGASTGTFRYRRAVLEDDVRLNRSLAPVDYVREDRRREGDEVIPVRLDLQPCRVARGVFEDGGVETGGGPLDRLVARYLQVRCSILQGRALKESAVFPGLSRWRAPEEQHGGDRRSGETFQWIEEDVCACVLCHDS